MSGGFIFTGHKLLHPALMLLFTYLSSISSQDHPEALYIHCIMTVILIGSCVTSYVICYVTTCRNGVGKSTLLRVLGNHSLVGFPRWLSCMHVAQEAEASQDTTAVDMVMAADVRAVQIQK